MSQAFSVRRLGAVDLGAMRRANALFAEVFEEPETYAAAPPSDAYLTRLLGAPHCLALVAEEGGGVIGALTAYEFVKFEQERSEIYIYDLAVAADRRRRGVATALIETLRDIAAERGAWVIFVQADRGDDAPIALYSKLGAREDVHHFDIQVSSSPPD